MHTSSLVALFALCGASIAAVAESPNAADVCNNGGFYYGEAACKENCQGGKCTNNQPNDPDYVCICKDPSAPGCSGMYKGQSACKAGCKTGTCTQLLLPYTCKC